MGRDRCGQTGQVEPVAPWPTRGGNPFADHVDSITKYVVASQPVDTTAWDPTVVIAGPDLLDEVSRAEAGRRWRHHHLGVPPRPSDPGRPAGVV
jgi:hypothetical protein